MIFNRWALQEWVRRFLHLKEDEGFCLDKYSFCESVGASSVSPWHIRRLDKAGRKLGGGITTASLCGRVKRGWDIGTSIHDHLLSTACRDCVNVFNKETENAA